MIHTTNAMEALSMTLRKVIKTCGSFPSEEAAFKVLYLALRDVAAKWHTIQNWKEVLNRLAILWEDRFPQIVS
ncbi:MAG: transposase [Acidobacteriaceae bacterium]|nr:transposase [Acidobacteriaceae bacterium]